MRVLILNDMNKFPEAVQTHVNMGVEAKGYSVIWPTDTGKADRELEQEGADLVITTDFHWAKMLLARSQPVLYGKSFTSYELGAAMGLQMSDITV